jgi:hypothetical protein
MADYHNPDEQNVFEEFRQAWTETTGLQDFVNLRSAELVRYSATQLVVDRFHPNNIVSHVVAIELLKEIWIGWYQLRQCDNPPGAWDPFYLDDYSLYDLLWVTLFYHHLTRRTATTSWGLCLDCPFPTVSPPLTRSIGIPTYPILATLWDLPDP